MKKLSLVALLLLLSCPAWAHFKLSNDNHANKVFLSWSQPRGGQDDPCDCLFEVLRSTISGGYYEILGLVPYGQKDFVDTSVDGQTTYFYTVVETWEDGSENDRSNEVVNTPESRK